VEVGRGFQVERSPVAFAETVDRLRTAIGERGLRLFAVIDHREAAIDVGLDLRPTVVLVFGSPIGGTPLMDQWPALALELPLRIAVWDGGDGFARVAYLTAESLVAQFELDPAHVAPLGVPAAIIGRLLTDP
jgi:uncharacterized protein (DUF302 family)